MYKSTTSKWGFWLLTRSYIDPMSVALMPMELLCHYVCGHKMHP